MPKSVRYGQRSTYGKKFCKSNSTEEAERPGQSGPTIHNIPENVAKNLQVWKKKLEAVDGERDKEETNFLLCTL